MWILRAHFRLIIELFELLWLDLFFLKLAWNNGQRNWLVGRSKGNLVLREVVLSKIRGLARRIICLAHVRVAGLSLHWVRR